MDSGSPACCLPKLILLLLAESRASLCRHHAEKARDLPMVTTAVIDCRAMAEATGILLN